MNRIPSQTIHLKVEEHFTITLKSRSTAGYQWVFSNDREGIISVAKKLAPQNEGASKLTGAAADELFIITGLQKGAATVYLKQVRIWETGSKPVEEKVLLIVVG